MATCVGEEGLDIGEVDLIVLFDVSKSPIRHCLQHEIVDQVQKVKCLIVELELALVAIQKCLNLLHDALGPPLSDYC